MKTFLCFFIFLYQYSGFIRKNLEQIPDLRNLRTTTIIIITTHAFVVLCEKDSPRRVPFRVLEVNCKP